jgi:hypothetical protein
LSVDLLSTQLKIQNYNFRQMAKDKHEARQSWGTREARRILKAMKAATYEKRLYEEQEKRAATMSPTRRARQNLFNTSHLGLNVDKAGFGKRGRDQARFKTELC